MSRNPNDLHPDILDAYHAFMSACKMHKIDVLVTCTYRSTEEQAELYTQGRTMPGRIVTNAKPGESKHNFKLANGAPASKAFDVVPLRNGKPIWGTGGLTTTPRMTTPTILSFGNVSELWVRCAGCHGPAGGPN